MHHAKDGTVKSYFPKVSIISIHDILFDFPAIVNHPLLRFLR